MSGICAIVNFDGSPVASDVLRRMAAGMAGRGPDGMNLRVDENAGLAHLALNTTPESLRERQPLPGREQRRGAKRLPVGERAECIPLCLVADARVDNREELIPDLTANGTLSDRDPTDADLILAAYQRWGEECPRHIIGDFAFCIWDGKARRLFCARDPIGVRLLHYCWRGKTLFVATTVGAILAGLGASPPVNAEFVHSFLACRHDRWIHETAYRGIFRLPPSHRLAAKDKGVSLTRYWTFGAQGAVPCRTEADYEACFRGLLGQAVRARMRTAGPAAFLVSGGLDSSSIASLADRLIASGAAPITGLMYSCVFDHTPGADEKEYARTVAEHTAHLRATFIPCDDCWEMREFADDGGFPMDEPETDGSRSLLLKPLRAAREHGCRVVLAGNGGDQVLGGEPYHTPSVLRDVGLTRLASELPHFLRYSRRSLWGLLSAAYLKPLIPVSMRKRIRGLRRDPEDRLNPFRIAPPPSSNWLPAPPLNSRSSQISYDQLTQGLYSARLLSLDVVAGHAGVEWRFPFLDRRLIDFMLGVPPRLRFGNGVIKRILRRALAGVLPEQVGQRVSFAHFSELQDRGLREKERDRIRALLKDSLVVRLGYAQEKPLLDAWESYWRGAVPSQGCGHLVAGLCLEAWLRARPGAGRA